VLNEAKERGEAVVVDLIGHHLELFGRGLSDQLKQRQHVGLHEVRRQLVQDVLARILIRERDRERACRLVTA
jgi:uncharacterized protein YciU (UPF0263 family)